MDKLKRITDLFTEGTELVLGEDETGTPVVIYVNKLNSFEDEEARRDGLAARAERIMELNDQHPEMVNLRGLMERWDKAELVRNAAALKYDEDYLAALDDIESDEAWREKLEYLRRMDELHNDADIPEDDEKRLKYRDTSEEYYRRIRELADGRQNDRQKELMDQSVDQITVDYFQNIRERLSMDTFMEERKITEIYYAARECEGSQVEGSWDHTGCDHRVRLLKDRGDVRALPEQAIRKITDALSSVTVDRRTAGNSAAPESSSASSEQLSLAEASTPSTQEVTAPVVVST